MTRIGINVAGSSYFGGTRSFSNLLAGSGWSLMDAAGKSVSMPADRMDAQFYPIKLNTGEKVARNIDVPTAALRGEAVDLICRWEGKATAQIWGPMTRNVKVSAQQATFTLDPKLSPGNPMLWLTGLDPGSPLRNVDCREVGADPGALFDPTFLSEVGRFSAIRFLKWAPSVENNRAVTWATRAKAGDGIIVGADGVAIEHMIALANAVNADPWFTIPWNADADYIRQFATLVKAKLNPGLKAYVETSNEVWNWTYPVTAQALKEGKANFPGVDDGTAMMRRYAQRSGEIMDIWSEVFTGQTDRIVRVASFQNGGTWAAGVFLAYADTASKIDAIATAPYFSGTLPANAYVTPDKTTYFFDVHEGVVDGQIKIAAQMKAFAAKHGKRYLAYEAGQHYLSPDDLVQLQHIERHPRMGALYTRYLDGWDAQVGDLMMLFQDYGQISKWGAWGLREFTGQALSDAPKASAVAAWLTAHEPVPPPPPEPDAIDIALKALDDARAAILTLRKD